MIHLTETGLNAGRTLCLAPRNETDRFAHAMYAPLDKEEFRNNCCPKCLEIWAKEAYLDTDEMPDWVVQLRTPKIVKKYRLKEDLYYVDPNWNHDYCLLTKKEVDDHICILYHAGEIFEYDADAKEFRNEKGDVSIDIAAAQHLFEEVKR